MVDTVLRYRHYGCGELQRFFGDTVFYSRSSRFRANCPGRPDVLRTSYESESDSHAKGGLISVVLEIDKCGDFTAASRNQRLKLWRRNLHPSGYQLRVGEGQPAAGVVAEVQAIMDGILSGLPLEMYATAHARQVRNYLEFMSSPAVKMRYSDIASLADNKLLKSLSTVPLIHYGLVEKGGMDKFHVMQLLEGDWVAWIDGDDLMPVFPNEMRTYRFMKERLSLYEGFRRSAYDELFGANRGIN